MEDDLGILVLENGRDWAAFGSNKVLSGRLFPTFAGSPSPDFSASRPWGGLTLALRLPMGVGRPQEVSLYPRTASGGRGGLKRPGTWAASTTSFPCWASASTDAVP